MKQKRYQQLTEKEKNIVKDILENGRMIDTEAGIDEAVIAEKIKKGEVVSVALIDKIRVLSEKKMEKIKRKVQFNFGENISVEMISEDEIKLTIGKEKIVLTGEQAKNIISNGFADKQYVSVTGVCKKETWEKEEKEELAVAGAIPLSAKEKEKIEKKKKRKQRAKKAIAAATAVLIIFVPFLIKGCEKNIPNPIPEPTESIVQVVEPTENPMPAPTEDPSSESINLIEYEEVFDFLREIKWIPGTTQQYQWSSNEDTYYLNLNNPYTSDVINKEMQENQQLLEDIDAFEAKYRGKTVSESEKDEFLREANDLLSRVDSMLDKSYESIFFAKTVNDKRIEQNIIFEGDLETESMTMQNILSVLQEHKTDVNNLNNQINAGGIII